MTTPNAALAYRVLDAIDADPESWDQGNWMGRHGCKTSACFAGWACILAGDNPRFEFDDDEYTDWVIRDGRNRFIPYRAAELLGVSQSRVFGEYGLLFDYSNTREDLGRLVAEIFGPRPGGDPA